jgi:hypothetical protein
MELGNHYAEILNQAVTEIKSARVSIAKQINTAANGVYWSLGKILSEKKVDKGHGSGVVNRLSLDLKAEFPEMGLSPRNLWNMKRFYERYAQADPKLQRCVAVLPWRHNLLLYFTVIGFVQNCSYSRRSFMNRPVARGIVKGSKRPFFPTLRIPCNKSIPHSFHGLRACDACGDQRSAHPTIPDQMLSMSRRKRGFPEYAAPLFQF